MVIVGTERGLESKLVPQAGLPLETIRAAGLKGMSGAKLIRNAALLPLGHVGFGRDFAAAPFFSRIRSRRIRVGPDDAARDSQRDSHRGF